MRAQNVSVARKSTPKLERLEARVTSEQKRIIGRAAEIRGTSITDLIVASALEAATKAVKDHEILVLNGEASRAFARALLNPLPPNARAKAAWRRYRKNVTAG